MANVFLRLLNLRNQHTLWELTENLEELLIQIRNYELAQKRSFL
jgi:hypothetical protein